MDLCLTNSNSFLKTKLRLIYYFLVFYQTNFCSVKLSKILFSLVNLYTSISNLLYLVAVVCYDLTLFETYFIWPEMVAKNQKNVIITHLWAKNQNWNFFVGFRTHVKSSLLCWYFVVGSINLNFIRIVILSYTFKNYVIIFHIF